ARRCAGAAPSPAPPPREQAPGSGQQGALHGGGIGLDLPAAEGGAVVGQHQPIRTWLAQRGGGRRGDRLGTSVIPTSATTRNNPMLITVLQGICASTASGSSGRCSHASRAWSLGSK